MNRSDAVLAAMAAAGENATFTPVQIQKLMFLIDREIPRLVGTSIWAGERKVRVSRTRGLEDNRASIWSSGRENGRATTPLRSVFLVAL
jgi:hypothetical protein